MDWGDALALGKLRLNDTYRVASPRNSVAREAVAIIMAVFFFPPTVCILSRKLRF